MDRTQIVRVRVSGGGLFHPAILARTVGPLGLSPKKVADSIAQVTADWRFYKIDVELHLRQRSSGPWTLDRVEAVPSTSLLVRRAFHKHTDGKWHAGQHGALHEVTRPNGSKRTEGCGNGGGDISFAEVLDIAELVRARELERHRQAMQGQDEPVGRRRKTSPCIAKDLRGTIKEVLGVVHGMRGLVEGEDVAVWYERLDNDNEDLIRAVRLAEADSVRSARDC